MDQQKSDSSLKSVVWVAIAVHLFLAFHNYCGVDGADWFSHYSQFAFGLPGARYFYYSMIFGAFAIPHLVSCALHVPLTVCAKIMQALCWIACSYLAVRMFLDRPAGSPRCWFICLSLNPVAIFNIHYHLQCDAMVFLLMLGGLALYLQGGRWMTVIAGLCWAVAVSAKVYPALLAPLFLFDRTGAVRNKVLFYASLALFFLLPEIPWIFRIGWLPTLIRPLGYRSFSRFGFSRIIEALYGVDTSGLSESKLFVVLDGFSVVITLALVALVCGLVYFKRVSLFRAMGIYFALLLLCSGKNTPQYFIFVVPFLLLSRNKGALIFANAAYAFILASFYLWDMEMNGSYCLLKPLSVFSISQEELVYLERFRPFMSLYVWGWLYLISTVTFVYAYRPITGDTLDRTVRCASPGPGLRSLLGCGAFTLWGISFFSMHFSWNPFSLPDNGLTGIVNLNTVLEPPSTLGWYGSTGKYELTFMGLNPGDDIRLSGDSYFQINVGDRLLGPFRGDGNVLYSWWGGISYVLPYETLRRNGFRAVVTNHLCSIRGVNAVTAHLAGRGRDWNHYSHMLEGKVWVSRCRVDGIDHDVRFGKCDGWLDSTWLTIMPKDYKFKGNSYVNVFTLNLLYIAVFFVVMGRRLRMREG